MASSPNTHRTYEELAERADRNGAAPLRDRYLVLAADAAWSEQLHDVAERLRQRLLQHNPHHLLKPFRSWAEAQHSADVRSYLADLRRNCPPEEATRLLQEKASEPAPPPAPAAPEAPPVYRMAPRAERVAEPPAYKLATPPAPTRPAAPRPAPPAMPARPRPLEETEEEKPLPGAWVAMGLFVLLLALVLALAGYTLGQPFLPW